MEELMELDEESFEVKMEKIKSNLAQRNGTVDSGQTHVIPIQPKTCSPSKDSMTNHQVDTINDVSVLRTQMKYFMEKCRSMEIDKKKVCLDFAMEKEGLRKQLAEAKSEAQCYKEEVFKEVQQVLEQEFSCCICNEVFIQVRFSLYLLNIELLIILNAIL